MSLTATVTTKYMSNESMEERMNKHEMDGHTSIVCSIHYIHKMIERHRTHSVSPRCSDSCREELVPAPPPCSQPGGVIKILVWELQLRAYTHTHTHTH